MLVKWVEKYQHSRGDVDGMSGRRTAKEDMPMNYSYLLLAQRSFGQRNVILQFHIAEFCCTTQCSTTTAIENRNFGYSHVIAM